MAWDEDDLDRWLRRWMRFPHPPFRETVFPDMDRFARRMERWMEETFKEPNIPKSFIKERKLPGGDSIKEMGPFIYGFSMTVGPDGKPLIKEFGNLKPTTRGRGPMPFDLKEERDPLVDVVETDGEVKVVAEVPGIEKKDISLNASEDTLIISVDSKDRKYRKELTLPTRVDVNNARSTYKNGILEVTLRKKKEEKKPKGVEIKLE
ncbi:MAG: archaeal heat shock protein Hsp20 [Candidatus Bathyarchaeia archaeon]